MPIESNPTTSDAEMAVLTCQSNHKDVIIDVESSQDEFQPLLVTPVNFNQTVGGSLPHCDHTVTVTAEKDANCDSKPCSDKTADRGCVVSTDVGGTDDGDARSNCTQRENEVQFSVGQHKQLMIGTVCQLAAISPVFESLFCERWRTGKTDIEVSIPDVETRAFGVILRCASGDADLDLTENTVWDVLKAADEYQVLPVVKKCFHFLLHKHRQRERSGHLCAVLEMACQLSYSQHYSECMKMVKRKAGKIFQSQSGLRELCHKCMLKLVKAEDLGSVVDEVQVHDAVITWARCACAKRGVKEPGWEELRDTAGELIYHVRYLVMPQQTLKKLGVGHPTSCLLTKEEIACVQKGVVPHSKFPEQVSRKRPSQRKHDFKKRNRKWGCLECFELIQLIVSIGLLILILLSFAVGCIFPVAYALIQVFR